MPYTISLQPQFHDIAPYNKAISCFASDDMRRGTPVTGKSGVKELCKAL